MKSFDRNGKTTASVLCAVSALGAGLTVYTALNSEDAMHLLTETVFAAEASEPAVELKSEYYIDESSSQSVQEDKEAQYKAAIELAKANLAALQSKERNDALNGSLAQNDSIEEVIEESVTPEVSEVAQETANVDLETAPAVEQALIEQASFEEVSSTQEAQPAVVADQISTAAVQPSQAPANTPSIELQPQPSTPVNNSVHVEEVIQGQINGQGTPAVIDQVPIQDIAPDTAGENPNYRVHPEQTVEALPDHGVAYNPADDATNIELPPQETPPQQLPPQEYNVPIDQPINQPIDQPADTELPPQDQPADYTALNNAIAAAALPLVGTTDGLQCTDIVQMALAGAGVADAMSIWPNEYALTYGYYTDNPQPGNLIYYNQGGNGLDHIAVYIGNGMAVHGNYTIDGVSATRIAPVIVPGCSDFAFIQVVR